MALGIVSCILVRENAGSRSSLDEHENRTLLNSPEQVDTPLKGASKGYAEHRGPRNLMLGAAIVAGLCTLANVGLAIVWHSVPAAVKPFSLTNDYAGLEVANSYINLDTAVYSIGRDLIKPIKNFPLVISRVNAKEPKKVLIDDTSYMSKLGLTYLEENEVVVDSSNSVILQFRMLDFGMERCWFTLSVDPSTYRYHSDSKLDIWQLDAPKRIDPYKSSWSTRPARKQLFTTLTLNKDTKLYESPEFACPSRSLQTFEVACSGKAACSLEFRQDAKKHDLGFYVKQANSIQYENDTGSFSD